MKKVLKIIAVSLAAFGLCACNVSVNTTGDTAKADEPGENENLVGMANPWRDCTEDEAYKYAPNGFSAPEGSSDERWSLMLPDNDPKRESETLVQLDFVLDGVEYTAREQAAGDNSDTDISGIYCEWQTTESVTLANWAGGMMPAIVKTYDSKEEECERLCIWYDFETGYVYSLSASGEDLSKVDIKAVAESIYDPAKQIGANAPEILEECPEEATDEFLTQVADETAPSIDISGCDTFTQIVDGKLSEGMGYANEKIGEEDVLLVSSATYDNLDGNMAAIDATVFMYKNGAPYEVGKVCCGGTAYPLAVKDGALYTASNHWICKYTLENDKLVITNKGAVVYNENGEGTYYYEASDGTEISPYDTVKTQEMFDNMFGEMADATIVNFSTVGAK